MRSIILMIVLVAGLGVHAAESVWLDSLDLTNMRQGWGKPEINKSVKKTPLSIKKQKFDRGVGTHAVSTLWIDLGGETEKFQAAVGVDDSAGTNAASIVFKVWGDGKSLFDSGVMKRGVPAKPIDLDVRGIKTLLLMVTDGGDGKKYDYADWADARFLVSGKTPRSMAAPTEDFVILTPKAPVWPRINGPAVYGCRPGHPFIYRIPTSGARPMQFSVEGMPKGLNLDAVTGIITGSIAEKGEFTVTLRAKNSHGKSERSLKIVCGDTLALTPPMGWNHWYAHYHRITDTMMRKAADELVQTGMADVGYQYVSIDDCWMNTEKPNDPMRVGPFRDASGNIIPNRHFPDMKGLTDYIHSKGLKAGIYTSPGPLTCGGYAASYQHEAQDARQFANWGFDFLKYDLCSYRQLLKDPSSVEEHKKPYVLMGRLLKEQNRDIVFNLCQYGKANVWEWGAEVGGHSWRTAGDLGFSLNRLFEVALKNAEHREWSKPGSWNDPDYLQIGFVGSAAGKGLPQPCPLSPNEQYAFMSLWCLMASPLFYSGDMEQLDEFTLNILCNHEVIEIDQDPLGYSARVIPQADDTFLMVKELADGSKAVGLCNAGEWPRRMTAKWSDVGIKSKQIVRDLWRQKDLGSFKDSFEADVPRRGVLLVRMRSE